ncbi:MAG: hypothetical protein ACR2MY_04155, partial [Candidatus Dormibacteria bacterium]
MRRGLPKGRLIVLLSAMALAMVSWMFSAPPQAAAALAPAQTAWWQVANQSGAPAVPPPPDVNTTKHDLYVHGAGGVGLPGRVPEPPTQPPTAPGGAPALLAIRS